MASSTNDAPNGHTKSTSELQDELRNLRLRSRILEETATINAFESWGSVGDGQYVNLLDRYRNGNELWLPLGQGVGTPGRRDGQRLPLLTEADLDAHRDQARDLVKLNPLASGVLKCLKNFVIGKGFRWQVTPEPGTDKAAVKPLVDAVQEFIDGFMDTNNWRDREKSWFARSRRDGEVFVRLFTDETTGDTRVRVIEPEHVRRPPSKTADPHCEGGIETDPEDVETVLGYWVKYPQVAGQGQEQEWERVDADEIEHLKLNVDETEKRGLSDFLGLTPLFDQTLGLVQNLVSGAKVQAALAGIRRHTQGKAGVESMQANLRASVFGNLKDPYTNKTLNLQHYPPGTILDVGNTEYMAPPWMSQGAVNHISIVQAALRVLGAFWRMPEFLISSDASNANYSSTLIAGSPFVIFVECEQDTIGQFLSRILWKAVRAAADAGRIQVAGYRYSYREIMALLDIQGTPPAVAISNRLEESQIDQLDMASGVLSIQTRRGKLGLDDAMERKNRQEEPMPAVAVTDAGVPAPAPDVEPAAAESRLPDSKAVTEAAVRLLWSEHNKLLDKITEKRAA